VHNSLKRDRLYKKEKRNWGFLAIYTPGSEIIFWDMFGRLWFASSSNK
jgi:hypothetical protein